MLRAYSIPLFMAILMASALTVNAEARNDADNVYLESAAQDHFFEIEVGRLCLSNSRNSQVREFGRMLVNDHSSALRKLQDEVRSRGLRLPSGMSEDQRDVIDMFSRLRADRFDAAVGPFSVADHIAGIKAAENELKLGEASEIKELARDIIPVLERHLDAAFDLTERAGYDTRYRFYRRY
jgi:putative membrane protein